MRSQLERSAHIPRTCTAR